ncbi:hypothetical protein [Microbulbifer sp. 2205BS26-8]|uniref:hypothetical protein n=1 Tax=Microbulbifer sp. 2205BS26-8 TaxID=3064386 RepID=UPI00273E5582|nr:hypothetical protein [Microbulbifer sp. 2205BS26-8]MDP5211291.1 hypothetical protein [Microbulbifer sp. 2205BS26-8]
MKAYTLTISAIAIVSFLLSQQALSLDALLKNTEEFWIKKRERDILSAPIKNQEELENYLAITPIENSPLNALSEIERELFINSLVFTKRGLAGFDYSMLSYGPTATEVYNILALFGSQSTTPFLPGLTIASESDSSIMAVEKIIQGDPLLLDSLCIWNTDIRQFFCGQYSLEICFPRICF